MSIPRSENSIKWHEYVSANPGTIGGNYLRKFWQPVALSSEVEIGKAKPIQIMGEMFENMFDRKNCKHNLIGNKIVENTLINVCFR